jgi:anti-sigma factor RsiW
MSCPKTKLISAYLDNEVGPGEKTAFEAHVQGCDRCSRALEGLRSLRAVFTNTERHQAPYGFATRVMARTAALEKKRSPWSIPLVIRFAEAAALVIVIIIGILAGRVMTNSFSASKPLNIASSLSLDLFDATPPGSLGNAYLAMTEVTNEK